MKVARSWACTSRHARLRHARTHARTHDYAPTIAHARTHDYAPTIARTHVRPNARSLARTARAHACTRDAPRHRSSLRWSLCHHRQQCTCMSTKRMDTGTPRMHVCMSLIGRSLVAGSAGGRHRAQRGRGGGRGRNRKTEGAFQREPPINVCASCCTSCCGHRRVCASRIHACAVQCSATPSRATLCHAACGVCEACVQCRVHVSIVVPASANWHAPDGLVT